MATSSSGTFQLSSPSSRILTTFSSSDLDLLLLPESLPQMFPYLPVGAASQNKVMQIFHYLTIAFLTYSFFPPHPLHLPVSILSCADLVKKKLACSLTVCPVSRNIFPCSLIALSLVSLGFLFRSVFQP